MCAMMLALVQADLRRNCSEISNVGYALCSTACLPLLASLHGLLYMPSTSITGHYDDFELNM